MGSADLEAWWFDRLFGKHLHEVPERVIWHLLEELVHVHARLAQVPRDV